MVLKMGERAEITRTVKAAAAAVVRPSIQAANAQRRIETANVLATKADVTVTDALAATDVALDGRLDVVEADYILQAASIVDHETRIATLEAAPGAAPAFRGAFARMNANDTTVNATGGGVTLSFDVADFDTDSFWSAGAPTRLTIPAGEGITYVELHAQMVSSSGTADTNRTLYVAHFNSSNVQQRLLGVFNSEGGATNWVMATSTGPIAVADGDYFTAVYIQETDSSVTIEGVNAFPTFLSLKVL